MKEINISIILPIYNVEKYLDKCILSIINQTNFEDIELLLIDDGSTDKSSEICEKYSKQFENIYTFHKKNGGLSDARNYGIYKAKGKYLLFIDSDDSINKDMLKKINDKIEEKPDIILWNAKYVNEDDRDINNISFKFEHSGLDEKIVYTGKQAIKDCLKVSKEFPTAVWLGVYKKSLIIDNNLFFENGLIHEDEMWTLKIVLEAQKVEYINESLYNYRIRQNSIMRDNQEKNRQHIESYIYIYNSLYEYYNWKIKDKELLILILDNLTKRYLHAISKWKLYKHSDLLKRISKKNLLVNAKSKKNMVRAIIFFINKKLYCRLTSNI